ncbi:MAG: hypothetical protein JXA33_22750 [Anaerolineae bacterium]|nr:hypothetical protein [Anaerolineae bacterium]
MNKECEQLTDRHNSRAYIRELALQVAEIAASKENAAIQQRWRDVNALRKPDRAPVWCRPVGAWDEILPGTDLKCADSWLRGLEIHFRRILIKHDIGDDSPVMPWFPVPAVFDKTPPNVWGVDIAHHDSGVAGGAWAYDPPLKSEADFDKLRLPTFTYNPAKTQAHLERVHDIVGDILPVKLVCDAPLTATLGIIAADLRGLTPMMLDMAANPAWMHRLMGYLRDAVLGVMAQVAATGLLTPNNDGPMICSDPLNETCAAGSAIGYRQMWVMANSQEFDPVSPRMWREFCLEYQRPIIEQFGLSAYGCCENLTRKIEGVLSLSNLRIFVCSAWTNLEKVQEAVGQNYVIMWRQKAGDVVFPDDIKTLRRDLERGARQLQGFYYQIVLRELQTLSGHPQRLHEWTRIAKEMAAKYS